MKRAATKAGIIGKIRLLASILVIVGLGVPTAFALDPMGPPSAALQKGQFGAGAEYASSEMDVKLNEGKANKWGYTWQGTTLLDWCEECGKLPSMTIANLNVDKVYANLAYGITDNWEAFLRLGGADIDFRYAKEVRHPFDPCPPGSDLLFPVGQRHDGDPNSNARRGRQFECLRHRRRSVLRSAASKVGGLAGSVAGAAWRQSERWGKWQVASGKWQVISDE